MRARAGKRVWAFAVRALVSALVLEEAAYVAWVAWGPAAASPADPPPGMVELELGVCARQGVVNSDGHAYFLYLCEGGILLLQPVPKGQAGA